MTWRNTILVGDVREQLRTLPDESVHCVVTSPPYFGLRDYGVPGQIGLEPTPEAFVCSMVATFREVWRVLRRDGTCWLNLGDSYVSSPRGNAPGDYATSGLTNPQRQDTIARPPGKTSQRLTRSNITEQLSNERHIEGLKPKDMMGMPWRVAFALQADGWWLRSDIIWSKPNPMPESVTDRPTKSHEYLFLLTRSERYYYDIEAIKEPLTQSSIERISQATFSTQTGGLKDFANGVNPNRSARLSLEHFAEKHKYGAEQTERLNAQAGASRVLTDVDAMERMTTGGRNRRTVWKVAEEEFYLSPDVWEIPTQPMPEAHFATYPEALVLPCIQAGTSEHGVCAECGAPWRRVVEREPLTDETKAAFEAGRQRNSDETGRSDGYAAYKPHQERAVLSTRWEPTCKHEAPLARAVVLDPFMGSGTTGLVAYNAGRDFVGVELNPTYAAMADRRIGANRGRLL